MKEKTKDWLKAMFSVFVFNTLIIGLLYNMDILNGYTFSLKIALDLAIFFVTDKSIKKFGFSIRDGSFNLER